MLQVLTFPEPVSRLTVRRGNEYLSDEDYFDFCVANRDLRIERTAEGEIVIVPPAGYESDHRNADVVVQLGQWAKKDGRGRASGPTAQFFLPDGSALSPDAAWVSDEALSRIPKPERKKFMHLAPEFIVEVMSPSDRLRDAKAKMEQWIRNGVQLGWLIDAGAKTVYVYRKGRTARTRRGVAEVRGEGPVEGFVLELGTIWKGV